MASLFFMTAVVVTASFTLGFAAAKFYYKGEKR